MPLDITGYFPAGALVPTDVTTLVQQAIADAQAGKWPDWIPREGQQEVILLELLASMVTADTTAFGQITGVSTEVLLRQFGLVRNPGTAATVQVRFTITAAPSDVTIPAGSYVVLSPGQGLEPVTFSTDTPLTLPVGTTTGVVGATATTVGAEVNGRPAGTVMQVLSALPYVDSAVTVSPVIDGTEPEDDASYLDRTSVRFSRLSDTLQAPSAFTAAAIEQVGVTRALTLDQYDPDSGNNPGEDAGHVTVAVAGAGGAPLSGQSLTDLTAALQSMAFVLITVHAINADVDAVDVTVTVLAESGYTASEVTDNVNIALNAYLNPDAWAWGQTVYLNEIIALVDNVIGVDRVVTVDKLGANVPGADFALTGVAPLADAGAVTVVVQNA